MVQVIGLVVWCGLLMVRKLLWWIEDLVVKVDARWCLRLSVSDWFGKKILGVGGGYM